MKRFVLRTERHLNSDFNSLRDRAVDTPLCTVFKRQNCGRSKIIEADQRLTTRGVESHNLQRECEGIRNVLIKFNHHVCWKSCTIGTTQPDGSGVLVDRTVVQPTAHLTLTVYTSVDLTETIASGSTIEICATFFVPETGCGIVAASTINEKFHRGQTLCADRWKAE